MQRASNQQGAAWRAALMGAITLALAPLAWAQCPGLSFTQNTAGASASTVSCGIANPAGAMPPPPTTCSKQTPQGYARAFAKGLNGTPTGAIRVTGVQWSVFRNDYPGIPVRINVYLDQDGRGIGANTPGVDCVLMNSTVVAGLAASTIAPCVDTPYNVSTTLSSPVIWPDGCDLWVEIENPEDGTVQTNPSGNYFTFRAASTAGGGQTAPTYFRPPQGSCGSTGAWIDVAGIGFPNTHLKMIVCYDTVGTADCPSGPDGACVPTSGDCCVNNGGPGCDSYDICACVCDVNNDPFCCDTLWDNSCVQNAQANCGLFCPIDAPPRLKEGSAGPGVSNLEVSPDDFGSVNSNAFVPLNYAQGGDWNDLYNATEVSFTNGFVYYNPGRTERQMLSFNPNWLDVGPDDGSCDLDLVSAAVGSDTNFDTAIDHSESSFDLTGDLASPDDTDLSFEVINQVDTSLAGDPRAAWTQTLNITNNSVNAISFNLLRQFDADMLFDPAGDFSNDEVGTNDAACTGDTFVFQREVGDSDSSVTISSPNASFYVGAKGGCDPDGVGMGDAGFAFGTDVQEYAAYGAPASWVNIVAAVPSAASMVANTDGASGHPACDMTATEDSHILLNIPVSLAGGASTSVSIRFTYGSIEPTGVDCDGGPVCPTPCPGDINGDGFVTSADLSTLILNWGCPSGGTCMGADLDCNGGVTSTDLSIQILNWGICD